MALEKKSIHVRIAPELHAQLTIMAEFNGKDIAEVAADLLERSIVGDFYRFSVAAEKVSKLGKMRDEAGGEGKGAK